MEEHGNKQSWTKKKTFDDIIKRGPSESAKRQMQHNAYQSIEVMDYIRKIHKGGGAGGQVKTKKVHTEQSET